MRPPLMFPVLCPRRLVLKNCPIQWISSHNHNHCRRNHLQPHHDQYLLLLLVLLLRRCLRNLLKIPHGGFE